MLSMSPRRTHEATRLLRHRLCTSAPYSTRRLPLPQPRGGHHTPQSDGAVCWQVLHVQLKSGGEGTSSEQGHDL